MAHQAKQSAAATVPPALAEDRSSARRSVRKHAILHCRDRVQTVLIRDISAGGMKVQNAFGLFAGDPVRIELLTRQTFEGTVAWSVPPYCGIRFNTPLREDNPLLTTNTPCVAPG
jgi:PilZ domain